MNHLIRAAVENPLPNPRYAYMAPFYKQAKAAAWDYAKHYTRAIPGVRVNESELRIDLPGDRRLVLLGADNPDALRGIYLDGVVLDEYAYMDPTVYQSVIRPTLVDREGFVIFIGTPCGKNHFHAMYEELCSKPDAFTALYRVSDTGLVPEHELDSARTTMGPDFYAQEFECSFEAAIVGAYYARQLERARADERIMRVPWTPAVAVDTFWDIGWSDATAIIFAQIVGRELRVIDYLEAEGRDLAWYAKQLQAKDYVYGRHYLPHDAGHEELGAGGRSIERQLRGMGVRPVTVLGPNDPLDGIHQARLLFPRCWFDATRCARLIDALGSYRAEWDGKRNAFKDKPLHDWSSHGADAFRYMAIGIKEHHAEVRQTHATTTWSVLDHNRPGRGGTAASMLS